ncbi:MAG: hypothetical protein V2I43_26035, partial [Parvularcula sp.]|nr:hypothetical protein [Parvularcula sp.]
MAVGLVGTALAEPAAKQSLDEVAEKAKKDKVAPSFIYIDPETYRFVPEKSYFKSKDKDETKEKDKAASASGLEGEAQAAYSSSDLTVSSTGGDYLQTDKQNESLIASELQEYRSFDLNSPFGEDIGMDIGSLSLSHTDVSIPGRSSLPVAFGRRYTIDGADITGNQLGGWIPDIPVISVRVLDDSRLGAAGDGWKNDRCSNGFHRALSANTFETTNARNAYWSGVRAYVPGKGSRLLLESGQTTDHWKIDCLPSVQNGTGEGFLLTDPQGTKYYFNYMTEEFGGDVTIPIG